MNDDEIAVNVADLDRLHLLLTTLHNAHSAQDLLDGYRKLSPRPRSAPLTTAIRDSLNVVAAYLAVPEDGEDPDGE